MPRKLMPILFLLLGLVVSRVAWADDAKEQAKQHFMAGEEKFKAGDYAGAIAEFQAADALVPSPILSFNIGLAYEKLGQNDQAIAKYQDYLARKPDASNRAQVEQRISALQAKIAAAKQPDPTPTPVAPVTPTPQPVTPTPVTPTPDPQSPTLGPGSKGYVDPDPNHVQQPTPTPTPPVDPAVKPDTPVVPAAPADPELTKRLPEKRIAQVGAIQPGNNTPSSKGPAEQAPYPAEKKRSSAKPVYKEWWFWVVVGVSAYIVVDMFSSHSSSNMPGAAQPTNGLVLFRF
jgi:iron complex outermembrane receptor protein